MWVDIGPSSLKAQENVLGTDVVCTDQLAVAFNYLRPAPHHQLVVGRAFFYFCFGVTITMTYRVLP